LSSTHAFLLALLGTIGVGVIDYATGLEVRIFPLYFIPVGWSAWRMSRASGVWMAVFAIASWELANRSAGLHYQSTFTAYWNISIQFCSLLAFALLLSRLRLLVVRERSISRTDSLTHVNNRRAFLELLVSETERAHRYQRQLTLSYIDLDNLKQVNDRHGHQTGDEVLVLFASLLQSGSRKSDHVARLGGDEFAVLLVETHPEQARPSLERIQAATRTAMSRRGWPVTASIGAVGLISGQETADQLMHRADDLMYAVKQSGKDAVRVASSPSVPAASTT